MKNFVENIDYSGDSVILRSFDFYTWFPYQSEQKCGVVKEAVLVNKWIIEGEGYFSVESALFRNKIPKNFHGCRFRASAIELESIVETHNYTDINNITYQTHSGVEVSVAEFVTKHLNLSLVYMPINGIGVQTRVDILSDLGEDRTDVTFGAFPLHELVYPFADYTMPYFHNVMGWYVPCGRPAPRMQKVMGIFTIPVWLIFVITIVLSAVVMNFNAKFDKVESPSYLKMNNSVLNVWAVVIGVSVTEMPRTPKLRIYFFLLVWYCFAMNTLFQAYFTSFLVDPGQLERIRTLEELYKSDLEYHFHIENDNYLKFSFPDYYSRIPLKRKECFIPELCLYQLIISQDFAVISHSFHTEYFTSSNNNPKLCTLDENIYKLSFAMHLAKGSPLLKTFDKIVHIALEGGFVGKWWEDTKRHYWIRLLPKDKFFFEQFIKFNDKEEEYVVLSLSHLQLSFYVLGIGCAIGLMFFMFENIQYSIRKSVK
ncbi:hypothetical protein L9F63_005317 [Diploptera punctata]|uniref:Uncharacterized protein n=1 Tax=Diploptera punctata TaxID=6984 RepID=A0AAD7ZE13_DIPPU|nr:hypothetical protein L9F63_005317 [Diploptera punctata]